MPKAPFKCSLCGRSFKMKAHLARHQTAGHCAKPNPASKKTKSKGKRKAMGRPLGVARRFGLDTMSIDELGELLMAARAEGKRRIAELEQAMR